jgi:hypothetical protein
MKRLDEKLRIARVMLEKLRESPMRWTPLMKTVVKESPSPWKAQVIIGCSQMGTYPVQNEESTRSPRRAATF